MCVVIFAVLFYTIILFILFSRTITAFTRELRTTAPPSYVSYALLVRDYRASQNYYINNINNYCILFIFRLRVCLY